MWEVGGRKRLLSVSCPFPFASLPHPTDTRPVELIVCSSVFMLYVAWKRGFPQNFSCFVLFRSIKKHSFNLLCVLDFFSERWQSTLFPIDFKCYWFPYCLIREFNLCGLLWDFPCCIYIELGIVLDLKRVLNAYWLIIMIVCPEGTLYVWQDINVQFMTT